MNDSGDGGTGSGSGPAAHIPGAITTVHRYDLPLPREDVWSLITDVASYRSWWPWLRGFDAAGFAEGASWRCEVQPPVPYLVRFGVEIDHVEEAKLVRATVDGDVVGGATLMFDDADAGCVATLHSSLAPGNTALRLVSRFAAPIARFGHDWVLDSGARQFIARAVRPLAGD
ncbi:MAG: SRPBCC family protein [Acidimicrobiales bacterium]